MQKQILTVTDTFCISGKGLAIVEKNPKRLLKDNIIGNLIIIINPDGAKYETQISGIENFTTVSGTRGKALLVRELTKADIPIGAKVFLTVEDSTDLTNYEEIGF